MRHHAASALAIFVVLGATTAANAQDGGAAPTDASAGSVDTTSATQGVSLTHDFLERVPFVRPNASGQRSFEDVAQAAPQVTADRYGFSVSGGLSPENLYLVDGLSVGDPTYGSLRTSRGLGGAQVPLEFLERVDVLTGAVPLEFGRASAGVLSVVTKSGSNELHGSVWGAWWPGALTANVTPGPSDASALSFATKRHNTGDFGAELGGALVRDRLFFYAGLAQSVDRQRVTRSVRRFLLTDDGRDFLTDDFGALRSEPLTASSRFDDRRSFTWLGKLTWRIADAHTLSVMATGTPQQRLAPVFEPSGADSTLFTTTSTAASVKYAGRFLGDRLLVDATAGWNRTEQATLPGDGSRPGDTTGAAGIPRVTWSRTPPLSIRDFEALPPEVANLCEPAGTLTTSRVTYRGAPRFVMACPVTGNGATYSLGGPGLIAESTADRLQARANVAYRFELLGHHLARAGADLEWTRMDVTQAYSGTVQLTETNGTLRGTGDQAFVAGPNERVPLLAVRTTPSQFSTGLFVQDSWSLLDVVTINGGLRFDSQQLFASDGSLGLSFDSMLSPRVGLLYDFTRQGRSKVFANYAVLHQSLPLDVADRALTGRFVTRTSYPGCTPAAHGSTDCTSPSSAGPINTDPLAPSPDSARVASGRVTVDPSLRPMAKGELTAGLEYEVVSNLRVGLVGTHQWLINAVETMSADDGATWFLGNPGAGLATSFPKAERKYFAATLYGSRAFSSGWLVQGSYTLSSLYGNYAGLFSPETGELAPATSRDFDVRSMLANGTGPLPGDRTHQFKAYVAKDFELSSTVSVRAGATYEALSGTPLSYLARDPLAGDDAAFVFARGSAGRTPWTHTVNVRGALVWKLTREQALQVSVDVFNLFNLQEATELSQRFSSLAIQPAAVAAGADPAEAACLAGNQPTCQTVLRKPGATGAVPVSAADLNSAFKAPIAWQQPLSVRLGVKLSF